MIRSRSRRAPPLRRNATTPGHAAFPAHPLQSVTITGLGQHGDGLASTPEGESLYVPGTVPGDRVTVRRTGGSASQGWIAQVVTLDAAGPDRSAPACPHYGACGGCALQHMRADAVQTWKQTRLRQALHRAGFDPPAEPMAWISAPPASRRRATVALLRDGATVRLGFRGRASHQIVDLDVCPVLSPALTRLFPGLRQGLAPFLPPAGPIAGRRLDLALTVCDNGVDLVIRGSLTDDLALREGLADLGRGLDLARLSWQPDETAPPRILIAFRPPEVRFAGLRVVLPPGGFLQATEPTQQAMIAAIRAAVQPLAGRPTLDLFAGLGAFTLPLGLEGPTHGVESDPAAVAALSAALRQPGAPGAVSVENRDLYRRPFTADDLQRFAAVVMDPPRAGAHDQARHLAMAPASVERLVMVSCNPATLARDLACLHGGGWRLGTVLGVDQFLWSPHLEAVVCLWR